MDKTIYRQWYLAYSPATIWEYLTNADLLSKWLMPTDFKPIVGHEFTFRTNPRFKFGFDGTIYGKVLEVNQPTKLVYSWKGGSNGKVSLDSLVKWTLEAHGEGILLQLEHSGFRGMKNYLPFLIMGKGWEINVLKKLKGTIESHGKLSQK